MLSVVTPSTVEPVSVADVKAQARIDHDDEDELIAAYITSARQWCEAYVGRNLTDGTNVLRLSLDSFYDERYCNCGVIYLPNPPLAASTMSITYTDSTGGTTTWASTDYIVDSYSSPARITPTYNGIYPVTRCQMNSVNITYTAGYTTGTVPAGCKTAIKMLAAHLYENREATKEGGVSDVPFGLTALLDPHKFGSYP